jgi:hypothetical protein
MGDKIKDLQSLMSCGDKFIEQQAGMALEIADAKAVGNITSEQAKELMEDLVRTDVIEGKSDNIQLVGALVTGVMGLASVV